MIRYTLDGSEPDYRSALYTGPISIQASRTLKAKAFLAEHSPSTTLTETYDLDGSAVAAPLASPAGGRYASRRVVTVTTTTAGATIHYTTDGEDPTESDPTITSGGTLAIEATQRLKLRAFKAGLDASDVRVEDYILTGAIAAGSNFTLVLKTDGTVWAAGKNDVGQLGQGVTGDTGTPVQVTDGGGVLTDVVAIAAGGGHAVAVKADGTVKSWGYNYFGQIGDSSNTNRFAPVPVPGLTNVVAVAAGDRASYFLKADGTVWACGDNLLGDLGDTTQDQHRTPVQVVYLTGITQIRAGARGGYALKTDGGPTGTVWAWGSASLGQIGDGANTNRLNAVSGLSGVRSIGAGQDNAFAIMPDGSQWAWGHKTGSNGDGYFEQRLAPVQSQISGVVSVDGLWRSAVSLDHEGRVWTVGDATYGQPGDPDVTASRAIPGRVPYLRDVIAISGGTYQVLVLKKDGTVWGWGDDGQGQLGEGTVGGTHSSPILTLFNAADTTWYLADSDADGLTNDVELAIGTDPVNADTNGDGITDGAEHAAGKDAANLDMDGDGLANAAELQAGSDPFVADTDGDGHLDGSDAFPIDPTRWQAPAPTPGDTTPPVITLAEPTNAVLVSVVPPLP